MTNNKRDIVFFTLFRTDNPYSSISLSMAKEAAKQRRVLYVNHPYTLKDIFSGILKGDKILRGRLFSSLLGFNRYETLETIPENFIAVQPPATLPINWLPRGAVYNFFQKINNGIVLSSIKRAVRKHDFKDYVYINCFDPYYAGALPKGFGHKLGIYHCIDDMTQDPYSAKHGFFLEEEAIRNADITFCTSTNLLKLKESLAPRVMTYFNAADTSVFERAITEKFNRPKELDGFSGPVVGFIGNMDALRIDYTLLKKCALAHPDKTFFLIGPLNNTEYKEIGLDKLSNVTFPGARKLHDLPPYIQHMDCVLIPFLCNVLTKSIYPLKINEYLSAGKPVISTSFSDDIRGFSKDIYLAENHEEFVSLIDVALEDNSPILVEQRRQTAISNNWEARLKQLEGIVQEYQTV